MTLIPISATLAIGSMLGKFFGIERKLAVLLSSGTVDMRRLSDSCDGPSDFGVERRDRRRHGGSLPAQRYSLYSFSRRSGISSASLRSSSASGRAALAIHDTSSVIGAASIYGAAALAIGAMVKLTHGLWILPVSYLGARLAKSDAKMKFLWFLPGFLLAALVRSLASQFETLWDISSLVGKHMVPGTLFLIGGGLGRAKLKKIGAKALVMAAVLWAIISCLSLAAVKLGLMPTLAI